MNTSFVIAQLLGIIGLAFLVFSWQKNNKKSLLSYQILSGSFFALQYAFLNAYAGIIVHAFSVIRNIIFARYPKRPPFYMLLIILLIVTLLSFLTYQGWISLLPLIASILYSSALWYGNLKGIRITNIISDILGIVYNVYVYAFVGIFISVVDLLSSLIAVYRFDRKKTSL